MKYSLFSCLFLLLICLTNCTEDEVLSTSYLPTDLELETFSVSDPTVPTLNKVNIDGSKVTLEFTNHAAPKKPEGGFELVLNGKRTTTTVTPRLHSSEKNLTMSFSLSNPSSYRFQIFARWNSGYVRSNEMTANQTGETSRESESTTSENTASANTVSPPSNPKKPVISDVSFNGSKVTLEFVNFSAPAKPEGGFELMLNGKRTATTVTPRLHSTEKNLTMSFSLDNPKNYYYQIYARWNSGYISSEKFYPGQASNTPSAPDETPTDNPSNGSEDNNGESNIAGLPELKLLRRYEFEDNIGRNVSQSQDGLQIHHLGNQGGKVVSLDGVGAYHFTTVADRARNHRHELVPRSLPTPHFNKGFISTWNEEYVYEMRLKLSENFEIGSGYTSIFEAKNDYDTNRSPSLVLRVQGDHYQIKLYYSTTETTNRGGEGGPETFLDANGNKLRPGIDFNKSTKTGHGYPGIEDDKGKWVKWTVHAKWTYDHSGFLKIYKDGKLFYSYKGPTSFKDDKAPYVKFGLYNSYWKNGKDTGADRQESYVDYFRVYTTK